MPVVTLGVLQDLATRALARAGANAAMASQTAAALVYADARGLASHGVSRVIAVRDASRERPRRWRGAAGDHPREGRRRRWSTRSAGSRFRHARSRSPRRSGARGNPASRFAGVTNSHHFGAAAYHLEAGRRRRDGRARVRQFAGGDGRAGGRRPLFGTNPIAAVFPRGDAPALLDRPVAVGGRARQGDDRGEGGQVDSAGLGARLATATRRPTPRPRSKARCCRWAARRARCWRSSSSCW